MSLKASFACKWYLPWQEDSFIKKKIIYFFPLVLFFDDLKIDIEHVPEYIGLMVYLTIKLRIYGVLPNVFARFLVEEEVWKKKKSLTGLQ